MDVFAEFWFAKKFPTNVYLDVKRARKKSISNSYCKEPVSKESLFTTSELSEEDGTKENEEAILASTLCQYDEVDEYAGFDFGIEHDWTKPTFHLPQHEINKIDEWLEKHIYQNNDHFQSIPTKSDGTTFELIDAKKDQQQILAYILDKVHQWFQQSKSPGSTPKPIRMTITGVAGSGKSFLTNALVTALRRIFGSADSVVVMAPTGEAAFNAGGETK